MFELLQALMQDPRFNAFYLVGGTSLALRFAHRESVDMWPQIAAGVHDDRQNVIHEESNIITDLSLTGGI